MPNPVCLREIPMEYVRPHVTLSPSPEIYKQQVNQYLRSLDNINRAILASNLCCYFAFIIV
jgi:hypothetical protein